MNRYCCGVVSKIGHSIAQTKNTKRENTWEERGEKTHGKKRQGESAFSGGARCKEEKLGG